MKRRDFLKLAAVAAAPLNAAGVPESFSIDARGRITAADARGRTYAQLELADRAQYGEPSRAPVNERPVTEVRSISRLFTSDVHDKAWFNDREMWPAYFDMLAAQRFNRFHLAFGIGYDFLREVTDAYLLFAYPFLVAPEGHDVRAVGLPDRERDANLAMLRYISEQAAERHLDFHLGLWTHGYQWENKTARANYTISGITADNHAEYCRDALATVLRACPAITGTTIRIHGESGVAEGNYGFWKTVFDGLARSGRKLELDLHAKGIDEQMIATALGSGMPVTVSPKFCAEHMCLPYHQADIRAEEIPHADRGGTGLMALSTGARSFTRYGYADLLRRDRKYRVVFRIWPGTQRLLLWGDPLFAAAYARTFGFCGANGVDIMEPLSFKGRRGSGVGTRSGYADASLQSKWDWEKYLYTYRVWGRALYNPRTASTASRYMRFHFGASAADVEAALAAASRVLPLVTSAYGPSAANNAYWPEMYFNQPIVDGTVKHPYSDTPAPKTFGNASPFDPQLFARVNETPGAKYSPLEVAAWLSSLADTAERHMSRVAPLQTPEFRRLAIDVRIQSGLARFFAHKFRAAITSAIAEYRSARKEWSSLAEAASVYAADITYGEQPFLRGHWRDRLVAIDADIAAMSAHPSITSVSRPSFASHHTPAGRTVVLTSTAPSVRLFYRHVTQAERWQSVEMQSHADTHRATIPAEYVASPYDVQYYFELAGVAMYPGVGPDLAQCPYFVMQVR